MPASAEPISFVEPAAASTTSPRSRLVLCATASGRNKLLFICLKGRKNPMRQTIDPTLGLSFSGLFSLLNFYKAIYKRKSIHFLFCCSVKNHVLTEPEENNHYKHNHLRTLHVEL